MRRIKIILIFLSIILFAVSCGGSSSVQSLTRENTKKLLGNPPQNQEKLKTGTFHWLCAYTGNRSLFKSLMVGFERTGESCSITVNEDNTVQVSFLGDTAIPIVSTSTDQYKTDTFIGELENNQVLIVQHHQGEVVISHSNYL